MRDVVSDKRPRLIFSRKGGARKEPDLRLMQGLVVVPWQFDLVFLVVREESIVDNPAHLRDRVRSDASVVI